MCNLCGGTGYVIVSARNKAGETVDAAKACECRKVKPQTEAGHPVAWDDCAAASEALAVMSFYPREEMARLLVARALEQMCTTKEQLNWTIERAVSLFDKWDKCGIQGLRQVLCSKHLPKDGISCDSTDAFPDGIPSQSPQPGLLRLPGPDLKRIEPGEPVSQNPRLDKLVRTAAAVMPQMPSGKFTYNDPVSQKLKDMGFDPPR